MYARCRPSARRWRRAFRKFVMEIVVIDLHASPLITTLLEIERQILSDFTPGDLPGIAASGRRHRRTAPDGAGHDRSAPAPAWPRQSAWRECRHRDRAAPGWRPRWHCPAIDRARAWAIDEVGLIAMLTTISCPVEMPPSTPPALLTGSLAASFRRHARCPSGPPKRKAGADLDALDGIDAHHGVGDVGIEPVIHRLAPADRHAGAPPRDLRHRRNPATCAGRPCSFELRHDGGIGREEGIAIDFVPSRRESRSGRARSSSRGCVTP
jgi:hypothetical protein